MIDVEKINELIKNGRIRANEIRERWPTKRNALGDANWIEMLTNSLADAIATATPSGSTSDGHHTFDELYEYRMLYNVHAAHGWLAAGVPVVKSWNHHDGEPCFGGGMFVVQAELPTGQVSNHYKAAYWYMFDVPDVELPPEYDGHTPQIAATRLRDFVFKGRDVSTLPACDCGSVDKYGDDLGEHDSTCPHHLEAVRRWGELVPAASTVDEGMIADVIREVGRKHTPDGYYEYSGGLARKVARAVIEAIGGEKS